MTNKEIKTSITAFEKKNDIKTRDFISEHSLRTRSGQHVDKYIAGDTFPKNIAEWLEICESDDDKRYFLKLLEEYTYFTYDQLSFEISKIIEQIKADGINISKTLFIVFPSKSGINSGGDSLSSLLITNLMFESVKENVITSVEKASLSLRSHIDSAECIVFIDDVIGSGKTAFGNIRNSLNWFNEKSFDMTAKRLYLAAICADEKKIRKKISQLNSIFSISLTPIVMHSMNKCFSSPSLTSVVDRTTIKNYEVLVNKYSYEKEKDYTMGFDKSELLVSFFYNTPNNTLSIFWLPSEISVPLFTRSSYLRPSISDCRKNKEENLKRAYRAGKAK